MAQNNDTVPPQSTESAQNWCESIAISDLNDSGAYKQPSFFAKLVNSSSTWTTASLLWALVN